MGAAAGVRRLDYALSVFFFVIPAKMRCRQNIAGRIAVRARVQRQVSFLRGRFLSWSLTSLGKGRKYFMTFQTHDKYSILL